MGIEYAVIALAGFIAFFIKGLMGVGVATVLISITALFIDPKTAIVLTYFAGIFGGLTMLKVDPVPMPKKFWIPATVFMMVGASAGAMALKYISPDFFSALLGFVFLAVAFWFIFYSRKASGLPDGAPDKARPFDLLTSLAGGFSAGLIGLNIPIMASYFGQFLNKRYLRRFFVLVYLPAALAQTATYIFNGLFTKQILLYGLCLLPGLVIGIYLGNRAHFKIPEIWFRRILGTFLIIVSIRLIF